MKTSVFVLIALVAALPAHGQDKTAKVDEIFSWVEPGMPGCVAAASEGGSMEVNRAYGLADLERNVPLTPDSVLDAGSIRKQFVAAAVLLLVEDGTLALTDDIREYIPELPDYGHTITVDHLLTHTSGIRDWVPLLNFAAGDPDAMSMILRQRHLNFAPGTEWSYSNSGYVLLPEIVARVSGRPFAEFLHARVLEPLGLSGSTYAMDPDVVIPKRALAYEPKDGTWVMAMRMGNERGGAGALFTTAADLVKWNDALANDRPSAFVSGKLQEAATLSNGRTLSYARGLIRDENYTGPFFWHSGSAAAYRSLAGHFPGVGVSVAVMCNAGEASNARDRFAGNIMDLFAADRGLSRPPSTPPVSQAPAAAVDDGRAGLYFNTETGEPFRLAVTNGRLATPGAGVLVPAGDDRFRNASPSSTFMSEAEIELHFTGPDGFEITTKEGEKSTFARAEPWAPSADDLQGFAGRYESDELLATFDVMPGPRGLMLRLNDAPDQTVPMAPAAKDVFQAGAITVRFQRDATGRVIALHFTSPVLRKVTYTRVRS